MPRIVVCLAIANLILLLMTAAMGLGASRPSLDRHVLLAVVTLMVSCGIQVVVFTYFTITGKMIGQAVHLGGLDTAPLAAVESSKKSASRLVGLVMVGVVFATATGAAQWRADARGTMHFAAAGLLVLVHALAFYREYDLVWANARLMDDVLRQYRARRTTPSAGDGPA